MDIYKQLIIFYLIKIYLYAEICRKQMCINTPLQVTNKVKKFRKVCDMQYIDRLYNVK